MSDKARFAAYNAVKRIFDGAYSNLIPMGDDISGIDRAFAESIAMGTLERKITLSYILSRFVTKETKSDVAILLMTGIHQILYMDKVPENAACDETVKIAKKLFGKNTAGFVNAVLRNICRNKEGILADVDNAEGWIKYSADEDLYKLLESQYPDEIENIFAAFLGPKQLFLRVNSLKTDSESVALAVNGIVLGEDTVLCNTPHKALALIDSGDFYIQGLASQEAVNLLDPKEGETVIDVCACPGGKSLSAALKMKNRGHIYSFDLHANKLPLINKSAEKLGIDIICTEKHDGRVPKDDLLGRADKVICDVPCSGTGVMGSKPEIKYKKPKEFEGLYSTQTMILNSAAKYLNIGGVMVYSTCSINKRENEDIVREFLAKNNEFTLTYEKTCMPFEKEGEGFYMARIIREK